MGDGWGYGNPENKKPFATAIMGDAENPRPLELLHGEHPHSRSDNSFYARDQWGSIHAFDGHRILIDVVIRSNNYMKESELSGDQIRKGGNGQIIADGVVVFAYFFRDPLRALLHAHQLIGQLSGHESGWLVKSEREKLVGRKIWYERTPAVITSLIEDQGCIIIKPDGVASFPRPVWADDDYCHDEYRDSVKIEVTSPGIWWWRNEPRGLSAGVGLDSPAPSTSSRGESPSTQEPKP